MCIYKYTYIDEYVCVCMCTYSCIRTYTCTYVYKIFSTLENLWKLKSQIPEQELKEVKHTYIGKKT